MDALAGLLLILVVFGIMGASAITNGFALSWLWAWFMVPIFGLPELSLVYVIGVSLTIGFLTNDSPYRKQNSEEAIMGTLNTVIVRPTLALLVGWVIAQFM